MGIEEGLKFRNKIQSLETESSVISEIDNTYEGEIEIQGIEAPKPVSTETPAEPTVEEPTQLKNLEAEEAESEKPVESVKPKKLKIPIIRL